MITKVRLKNWKSHLNSEFEFTQGVNALVGIMGSGKSSVLDAISFALFGTFPNLNSKKITLDDLIMKRPQEKEEAEVEVDFSVDGKSYSVRRRIGKDKGTVEAEIREGQRLVEVNPASVTEHVERVLQIDYPLFSKAVYSEQNNIDYFLTIPKGKRMQHIDRMLRLDLFENVRECVGSIKNLFEAKVSEKIRLLSEIEKDDMETKVAELKKVMENNRDVAEKLKVSLERLELKRVEAAGKLKVAEKKVEEALRVEKNSEALKATIHEVENNLDGLKEKTMGMDKEKILSEKKLVEMQISGFRQEILKQKNLLDGRRALIAGFNTEIRLASESIKDLERLGDRCPVCESGITVEKRADLEKSRKNREEELRKNVGLLAGEVEKIKNDLESLEIELRKREREAIQIENVIGEFENIGKMVERLDGLRKQNRDMEDRKIYLELEVKDLNVERLRLDLQEIITEAARNQVDFVHLNRLVERDRESLGDFEKRLGIVKRYRAEVGLAGKNIEELGRFVAAIRITQDQLREEFTKTVNYTMSRVWKNLYPYGDFEDIRLVVDGDYILQLKTGGEWVPVDGVASGGERNLACLALRVAFSLAFIPNLKWLILDEPTHNLDANAIRNFSEVLRGSIGSFVKQIFLITHEPRIAEDIDGFVYRLERDKAANGVTQVVGG